MSALVNVSFSKMTFKSLTIDPDNKLAYTKKMFFESLSAMPIEAPEAPWIKHISLLFTFLAILCKKLSLD